MHSSELLKLFMLLHSAPVRTFPGEAAELLFHLLDFTFLEETNGSVFSRHNHCGE